jgi:hypothetical protein
MTNYAAGRTNELLAQFGDVFNAASAGTIRLNTKTARQLHLRVVLRQPRRDACGPPRQYLGRAQTDTALTQDEHVTVKLSRKIKPVATTRDAWLKAFGSMTQAEFGDVSCRAGRQHHAARNGQQRACCCPRRAEAADRVLRHGNLARLDQHQLAGVGHGGDGRPANRIKAWVMHSKPYYDLVKNQIGGNITNVSDFNIVTATPITLNRPVIVTDSSSLIGNLNSPDVNNYFTLGLVDGAIEVENSEEQYITFQEITGLENLVVRMQGEYAYNVG